MFRKDASNRIRLLLILVLLAGSVMLLEVSGENGRSFAGSQPAVFAAGQTAAYDAAWTRQFGTEEQDFANAITTGPDGDFYVTGSTFGDLAAFNQGLNDFWMARYGADGTRKWLVQEGTSGGDSGRGVSVAANGHIYAAGSANGLGWIRKYNSEDGTPLTGVFFMGDSAERNGATALARAPNGMTFVAGWTTGDVGGQNQGNNDMWLQQFAANDTSGWVRKLGTGGNETPWGMATDSKSNVYVTGRYGGADFETDISDAFIVKYNTAGEMVWLSTVASPEPEHGRAIAIDEDDNLYVTGWTSGELVAGGGRGKMDGWLAKYGSQGARLWLRQFGTGEDDLPYGIALTAEGTILVSGASAGAWVAEFDADGNLVGEDRYPAGEAGKAITTTSQGGIYLAGETEGNWGTPNTGATDVVVARLAKSFELHGWIYTGRDQWNSFNSKYTPLAGVPLQLRKDGQVLDTAVTGDNGRYVFNDPPREDGLTIRVTLAYEPPGADGRAFEVHAPGPTENSTRLAWGETEPFDLSATAEDRVEKDILFGFDTPVGPTGDERKLYGMGYTYYLIRQGWRFAGLLGQPLDFNLPLEVHSFSTRNIFSGAHFALDEEGDPFIGISSYYSRKNVAEPTYYPEWHEFGHFLMADTFDNQFPKDADNSNHAGFAANPSSADAWTEGFATFIAMVIERDIGQGPTPHLVLYPSINVEGNYRAVGGRAKTSEELAVAGLLWDLVDPQNERDGDCIEIDFRTELWPILARKWGDVDPALDPPEGDNINYNGYLFDVKQLYDVLKRESVGSASGCGERLSDLEELFVAHGIFADLNDNQTYDHPEEREGIGRAADQGRPGRRYVPLLEGSYIQFAAQDAEGRAAEVDSFQVAMRFDPPHGYLNFTYEAVAEGDLLYFFGPDASYGATASITALGPGTRSTEPLIISNDFYWQEMAKEPQDHFTSHIFTMETLKPWYLPAILGD